jgi:hypothetical protein
VTSTTYSPTTASDGTLTDSVVMLNLLELIYSAFNARVAAGQSAGEAAVKETMSLNLYREPTPIVAFSVDPGSIRRVDGQAKSQKSGWTTLTVTFAERVTDPLVPLTSTL